MGENSGIAWTDATFNPWWGCTRVSPGCEHCYAETLAVTRRKLPVWGVDAERKPMSEAYWREPLKWNRKAASEGVRRRVFCASMADVFEIPPARNVQANKVMEAARARLWTLIRETPSLDWLLLTKRPENITKLAPWGALPWPDNVWLGTTAEDQKRYDERWSILERVIARVRFISHEPAIGPIVLHRGGGSDLPDWVITGGESGPGARPYDLAWARYVVHQCADLGIVPFVKQLGTNPVESGARVTLSDRKGGDPAEWPAEIRVQEFPATPRMSAGERVK